MDALRGVDAEFAPAAVTAVVGPSGSGKSTLLRLLAALDRPTAGEVIVAHRSLNTASSKGLRAIRRDVVGYVFQRPADNFVSYLTVADHLRLAARTGRNRQLAPSELLEALELSHRRDHLPAELSGGEQQRAAFAFALAAEPKLIVADEPTAELDSESSRRLLRVVQELASQGVAFVLATHDGTVVEAADEVLALEHGRRVSEASPAALPRHPERNEEAAAATEPLVAASRLRKTYARGTERIVALDDVDLVVARGDMAGVLGRSGSGKTTLLNVIFGWEKPESGAVVWLAESDREVEDLRWSEVALLPQKFGLIEEFTIRENVEYPARLADRLTEHRPHVDRLLAQLGLQEISDRLPTETSVGEQQRAGLARALVLSPQLVLADEPTGHQDAASSGRVLRVLRRAAAAGTASLIATHNEQVATHLDVALWLKEGRITSAA